MIIHLFYIVKIMKINLNLLMMQSVASVILHYYYFDFSIHFHFYLHPTEDLCQHLSLYYLKCMYEGKHCPCWLNYLPHSLFLKIHRIMNSSLHCLISIHFNSFIIIHVSTYS